MSNAIIGIKIADGSFYPILEEGKPGEKKLEVTTVRDDQTTIQINLYKSETGDMSDADYVDTLLIDNLVPHHKEEPSFGLVVKIDEDDVLSAEIEDPETGERSNTKVSLVNMGNKSIFDEPDYNITPENNNDIPVNPESQPDLASDTTIEGNSIDIPESEGSEDINDILSDFDFELPEDTGVDPTADMSFDLPDDFGGNTASDESFNIPEEPVSESSEAVQESTDDFSLPDFDSLEAPVAEETAPEPEDFSVEEPLSGLGEAVTEESVPAVSDEVDVPGVDTADAVQDANDDFSLPDFDSLEVPVTEETKPVEADTSLSDMSFDLPEDTGGEAVADMSFDIPEEPVSESSEAVQESTDDFSFSETPADEEPIISEPVAESVLSDDDFSFSTDFVDDENDVDEDEKPFSFDSLPDFDEIPELADTSGKNDTTLDDDLDIDFSIPEANDMKNNDYENNYSEPEPEYNYAASNNMQSALFGGDDLFEETKKQKERKVLVPLIICILCAVISLGVLGVILYLTPSIMKIAGGMENDKPAVVETVVSESDKQNIAAEEEIVIEEPVVRKVEENKIVVLNETVPPVVPETKKERNEISSIIRHLVKWGDTLWDLAGFYYRNPWLYRIISDANNLENPDLIISGTYLTIPDR